MRTHTMSHKSFFLFREETSTEKTLDKMLETALSHSAFKDPLLSAINDGNSKKIKTILSKLFPNKSHEVELLVGKLVETDKE